MDCNYDELSVVGRRVRLVPLCEQEPTFISCFNYLLKPSGKCTLCWPVIYSENWKDESETREGSGRITSKQEIHGAPTRWAVVHVP